LALDSESPVGSFSNLNVATIKQTGIKGISKTKLAKMLTEAPTHLTAHRLVGFESLTVDSMPGTRGHGDKGTRGHGDTGTRGHGRGTRGQGTRDKGTRGQGDKGTGRQMEIQTSPDYKPPSEDFGGA